MRERSIAIQRNEHLKACRSPEVVGAGCLRRFRKPDIPDTPKPNELEIPTVIIPQSDGCTKGNQGATRRLWMAGKCGVGQNTTHCRVPVLKARPVFSPRGHHGKLQIRSA
jgi:hypothetical protein